MIRHAFIGSKRSSMVWTCIYWYWALAGLVLFEMYLLVLGTGWSNIVGYFGPIRFMPKLKAGLIYKNLFD